VKRVTIRVSGKGKQLDAMDTDATLHVEGVEGPDQALMDGLLTSWNGRVSQSASVVDRNPSCEDVTHTASSSGPGEDPGSRQEEGGDNIDELVRKQRGEVAALLNGSNSNPGSSIPGGDGVDQQVKEQRGEVDNAAEWK